MRYFSLVLLFAFSLFAKEITLDSSDGFKLYGWVEMPKNISGNAPIAVFAHQFGADHTIWNDLAGKLRSKGYATLLVDLRGHGKSIMQEGKKNEVINDTNLDHIAEAYAQSQKKVGFEKIPSDLALWLDKIGENEQIDMERLVLFGSSLGGGAILPLMVDYEPKAIIAISPGGDEKSEAIKTALNYSEAQSLFIAGNKDPLGAQDRALSYANMALRGTYLMISSDGHGTVLLPRVENYIFEFLNQNIAQ